MRCPCRCWRRSSAALFLAHFFLLPWLLGKSFLAQIGLSRYFRRRRPKKESKDDDPNEAELGAREEGDVELGRVDVWEGSFSLSLGGNAGYLPSLQSWQVPELHMECKHRTGARIHKNTSVLLPEAGDALLMALVQSLPLALQYQPRWHLGYSMAVDGVSLKTLYRCVGSAGPCILIVEDSSSCIFGAFLSEGLCPGGHIVGGHDCCVFRYPRTAGAWRTEIYAVSADRSRVISSFPLAARAEGPQGSHWANYYEAVRRCESAASLSSTAPAGVFCDDRLGIVIGVDGPALFIDQNLLRGVSWPSQSFGSPSLPASGPEFVVRNLEVWSWRRG